MPLFQKEEAQISFIVNIHGLNPINQQDEQGNKWALLCLGAFVDNQSCYAVEVIYVCLTCFLNFLVIHLHSNFSR